MNKKKKKQEVLEINIRNRDTEPCPGCKQVCNVHVHSQRVKTFRGLDADIRIKHLMFLCAVCRVHFSQDLAEWGDPYQRWTSTAKGLILEIVIRSETLAKAQKEVWEKWGVRVAISTMCDWRNEEWK